MNVVVRGLMAAGIGVYGTIHVLQAFESGTPVWMNVAFGLAAVIGYALVIALVVAPERFAGRLEALAAGLALVSAIALTLTLTTGFFGVEDELRLENLMAYVAEAVVIGSYVLLLLSPDSMMSMDEDRPAREII
jgi:hypothetical protein